MNFDFELSRVDGKYFIDIALDSLSHVAFLTNCSLKGSVRIDESFSASFLGGWGSATEGIMLLESYRRSIA